MLQALLLLRKYWPIIKVVLALIRANRPLLDKLIDRPETGPKEDTRDFVRDAEWDPFNDMDGS